MSCGDHQDRPLPTVNLNIDITGLLQLSEDH